METPYSPHSNTVDSTTETRRLRQPLPIGYHLHNRYIITELLSDNGGFGMTYRAVDTYRDLNLDVVVKENFPLGVAMRDSKSLELYPVHKMEGLYSKVLKQFEDEAELLTTINHPNIVRVTAHFSELNTAYYVMPYIGGTELSCALPHPDRLSEAELLPILRSMLQALHYMHNHNLLHRDIKSNNILIDDKGNPILIDFGLVRSIDKTHHFTRNYTPGFAPLEQITGLGKSGFGTDLYSLGATCYVLITSKTPSISEEAYIPLKSKSELHARYSTAFLAGIDRALRMNINDRWKTANEWLKTLPREKQTDKSQRDDERSSGFRKVCKILLAVILSLLTITWLVAAYTIGPVAAAANGAATLLQSWLILPGIDVNKTVNGRTPLHWAVYALDAFVDEGHYECVQLLIDAGADVNKLDDDGNTPLTCPHFFGYRNPRIFEALIDAGANVNHEDPYGYTFLHEVTRYNPELLQTAINAGGDINKEDKEGYTPLHHAVKNGKPQCVLVLTDAGADVNKVDKKGTTPLCLAVEKGHPKCARQLIAAGVDVNKANAEGETPLTIAVDKGHTECMKLLLNAPGIDVNKAGMYGRTPLHRAAYNGHSECVKLLLAAPGIDVNKADEYGETPLYMAACYGHSECVKLLLAAPGIEVNKADEHGRTPLYWAVREGHSECVKLLLAAPGIDVNKANEYDGETPLHEAAHYGRTECVKLLLAAPGIDVNKADKYGETPLTEAESKGHTECARLIRQAVGDAPATIDKATAQKKLQEMGIEQGRYNKELLSAVVNGNTDTLSLLLTAGADVNYADEETGRTPLWLAAGKGHTECVRLLLVAPGIDVNKTDKYGWTPLYRAANDGRSECVKLLLAAPGIDVNKADKYLDSTPLYWAAKEGHSECVKLLLAAPGIDVNKAGNDDVTPLIWAAWKGYSECVKLLLAAPGIDVNKAYGSTPLYWAARNGHSECVKLLLAAPGIDVNKADEDGRTPLHRAESEGHSECARLIREAGGKE